MEKDDDVDVSVAFTSATLCRKRLANRRRRQVKLRRMILQYLTPGSENSDVVPPTGVLEELLQRQALLKRLSNCLGHSSPLHNFQERSVLNSFVMPATRTIESPRLSASSLQALSPLAGGIPLSEAFSHSKGQLSRKPTAASDKGRAESSSNATGERISGNSHGEEAYSGPSTFLKGTQSSNPHNDYCQHFVDTGERPQNFIRDTGLRHRFEEYPKLRELMRLKDELIQARATPPMYLKCDLRHFDLQHLNSQFDVILVEPPTDPSWSWSDIENLKLEKIAAPRSFIWIWASNGDGLEGARKCLRKWGFRRCEDICWIKTNKTNPVHSALEAGAVLQRTKEHCLMGIHGTVRRSVDGDFIHANLDIDLIISDEHDDAKHSSTGIRDKPEEIFHIIEHFCQGRRRLHLFGRDSTLRAGWLTVGSDLSASNFDAKVYGDFFNREPNGTLLGRSEEIERRRPKSPPPRMTSVAQPGLPPPGSGAVLPPAHLVALAKAAARMSRMENAATTLQSTTPSLLGQPSSASSGATMHPRTAAALSAYRFPMPVSARAATPFLNLLLSSAGSIRPQQPIANPLLPSLGVRGPANLVNSIAALRTAMMMQQQQHQMATAMMGGGVTPNREGGATLAVQMFIDSLNQRPPPTARYDNRRR